MKGEGGKVDILIDSRVWNVPYTCLIIFPLLCKRHFVPVEILRRSTMRKKMERHPKSVVTSSQTNTCLINSSGMLQATLRKWECHGPVHIFKRILAHAFRTLTETYIVLCWTWSGGHTKWDYNGRRCRPFCTRFTIELSLVDVFNTLCLTTKGQFRVATDNTVFAMPVDDSSLATSLPFRPNIPNFVGNCYRLLLRRRGQLFPSAASRVWPSVDKFCRHKPTEIMTLPIVT